MWEVSIALLLVVLGLWFRWRKKQFSIFKELGIPGPEPSIIFGNLWEMAEKTPLQCHEEWVKKYGKVLGYFFGGIPTLLVADTELMKKILVKDFHNFANRPLQVGESTTKNDEPFSNALTTLRDKRWKEIRSIITPSFTTSKMRMMSQTMNSAVSSLMEIMDKKSKAGKSFDMYDLYKGLTMDVIGRAAFGIQTDCQNNPDDVILRASKTLMEGNIRDFFTIIVLSFPELGKMWQRIAMLRLRVLNKGSNPMTDMADILKDVIKTRRQKNVSGRNDLLQIMIDAGVSEADLNKITDDQLTATGDGETETETKQDDLTKGASKKLRDNEIIDNSLLFFLAGYETTSTALAFTTHFLLYHPEIQEKLRDEVKDVMDKEGTLNYNSVQKLHYLDQVFTEALRMYPPIHLFVNREAAEDIEYGSYKIKKGLSVQIPVHYINHDPDLWVEPEKFNPSRFSPENKANHNSMAFQTFGSGPRNCVGMRFAQLEAKLALARILEKYKLLRTDKTDKELITLKVSPATLTPGKGVFLRAVPI